MLKFILLLLLFFFIFSKIIKYAFKYWLMSQMRQSEFFSYSNPRQKKSKEGEIRVEANGKEPRKPSKKFGAGDYVDYEIVA